MTKDYDELKKRIAEKRKLVIRQEEELKEQVKEIANSLSPGKIIAGAVKNVFNEAASSNGFIKTGIGIGATVLVDRFLFPKAGFFLRSAGIFAVRKLVSKFGNRKTKQIPG
jgi:hypothetical protein